MKIKQVTQFQETYEPFSFISVPFLFLPPQLLQYISSPETPSVHLFSSFNHPYIFLFLLSFLNFIVLNPPTLFWCNIPSVSLPMPGNSEIIL